MKYLLVEDDPIASKILASSLQDKGHIVVAAYHGLTALKLAQTETFDAIIMDRMLPKMDGLTVIKKLRSASIQTPVIILSALGEVDDRVKGLQAGGDDYLVKPYALPELLARLEVMVRRQPTKASAMPESLTVADCELNLLSGKISRQNQFIHIQPQERKLLEFFMRHPNQLLTRQMLLEKVWDFHFETDTNMIDTQVSRLRAKIDKPFDVPLIHTLRGKGYCFGTEPVC